MLFVAENMGHGKKVEKNREFIGSRDWVSSTLDFEKLATSRPKSRAD